VIAAVGGAALYVDHNYANAQDVKEVLRNQSLQIDFFQQSQKQNLMFQLEYYDDKIKKLEIDRARSEEINADQSVSRSTRAYTRRSSDIQEEINELKLRRDIVKRSLIASDRDPSKAAK
jgi:hypothetical protein